MKRVVTATLYLLLIATLTGQIHSLDQKGPKKTNQEYQDEKNRRLNGIDSQSDRIKKLIGVSKHAETQVQYELHNKKVLLQETFLRDGSYFVTKFDSKTIKPISTNFYIPVEDSYVNTTKAEFNKDGSVDIHNLSAVSGKIESKVVHNSFSYLFNLNKKPTEHVLNQGRLKIEPRRNYSVSIDIKILIDNARTAQENGKFIDMVESDDTNSIETPSTIETLQEWLYSCRSKAEKVITAAIKQLSHKNEDNKDKKDK